MVVAVARLMGRLTEVRNRAKAAAVAVFRAAL